VKIAFQLSLAFTAYIISPISSNALDGTIHLAS